MASTRTIDALLEEYRALRDTDPEASFEQWLTRYPDRADELREAHADWEEGLALLDEGDARGIGPSDG